MTRPWRVAVVGAGAVGGLIAARLARSAVPGLTLSVLARGATLHALTAQGRQVAGGAPAALVLHDAQGMHTVPLAAASDDAAALGVQDLVIVAVKATALSAVAPAVAALVGPHTAVVTAQNGLPWWFTDRLEGPARGLRLPAAEAGGAMRAAVPTPQVIGAVLHFAASVPAPGQVRHASGEGIILGLPGGAAAVVDTADAADAADAGDTVDAAADAAARALPRAAALLTQAGFAVTVAQRIERDIWFKLWGNMTLNPVSALTGATCDRILDDELLRGFVSAVMREAQALGTAIGLPIAQAPEERHAVTRKLGAFKTSMLQDREAGRPLEIDALVAAPHELARALGLATPQLDALLGLARVLAATPAAAAR